MDLLLAMHGGGGSINMHMQMIVRNPSVDAPNEHIFHDFVSFNIS